MPRPTPADPLIPRSVRLPKTLWAELQEYSAAHDLTPTQVLRRALRDYLHTHAAQKDPQ